MRIFLIICCLTLLYACNSSSSSHSNTKPNTAINLLMNPDDSMDWVIQSYGSNKLNLSSISKGVDSFEMRLWFSDEPDEPTYETTIQKVVIVKKSSEEWLFTETTFWVTMRNDTASNGVYNFDIDSSKTRKLESTTTEPFIDRLKNYTQTLPNSKDLEGTVSMNSHGRRYIFEIATQDYYKFIPYNCGIEKAKAAAHEDIRKFLNFLSSQLSVSIPACTK